MSAWIAVSERLPDARFGTSGPMLVWVPHDDGSSVGTPQEQAAMCVYIADYHVGDGWIDDTGGTCTPTHWMPLPGDPQRLMDGPNLEPTWERGYVELGEGRYVINHSRAGEPPELVISIASEADKSGGRQVGESRDTAPDALVLAEDMLVRIAFASERGLFALEDQLRMVREVHFAMDGSGASELLPCPFCGSTKQSISDDDASRPTLWCDECAARCTGAYNTSNATLIAAWNRRAPTQDPVREAALWEETYRDTKRILDEELIPERDALRAEVEGLRALLNTPELVNFRDALIREAAHQRDRWGSKHDDGKSNADWFWLIGYLAGKAMNAAAVHDREKALHHIVTTASACANWHAAMLGKTDMRPGIASPEPKREAS